MNSAAYPSRRLQPARRFERFSALGSGQRVPDTSLPPTGRGATNASKYCVDCRRTCRVRHLGEFAPELRVFAAIEPESPPAPGLLAAIGKTPHGPIPPCGVDVAAGMP